MQTRRRRLWGGIPLALLLLAPDLLWGADHEVSVLHPPSLGPLVAKISEAFADVSGIQIVGREADGLLTPPRAGTDVVLATDLETLRRSMPNVGAPSVLVFASDAMVIAYPEGSPLAGTDAVADTWFGTLARDTRGLGRGDPDTSPLGLRGLFVLDLAGRHYGDPALALSILRPGQAMPVPVLVRRLQESTLSAALLYRSLATRAGLGRLDLPNEIDLGDPAQADTYAQARVDLDGHVYRGAPILLGAAALPASANLAGAARLLEFLESPDAGHLLRAQGFVIPPGLPARRVLALAPPPITGRPPGPSSQSPEPVPPSPRP